MVEEITQNVNKQDKRGKNPNSLKNLRPNKNGRPRKEVSITNALREYMTEVPTITVGGQKNTDKTWAQLVALGMLLKSVKGDASMAREIIDRLEGKVTIPVSVENKKKELTDAELDAEIKRLEGIVQGPAKQASAPSTS